MWSPRELPVLMVLVLLSAHQAVPATRLADPPARGGTLLGAISGSSIELQMRGSRACISVGSIVGSAWSAKGTVTDHRMTGSYSTSCIGVVADGTFDLTK
jgi:hypothetical protein